MAPPPLVKTTVLPWPRILLMEFKSFAATAIWHVALYGRPCSATASMRFSPRLALSPPEAP
eukprot:6883607-Lingulodinium_polyedra.AAC.1